jgi:hypothetical protein
MYARVLASDVPDAMAARMRLRKNGLVYSKSTLVSAAREESAHDGE